MASGFTNYLGQRILRLVFGNVAYTVPTNLYIGLSTTTVQPDGTGITEPVDPSYARLTVQNTTASWEDIPSIIGRRNLIDFTFAPATTNWGTVTYMFISDAITGGNIIAFANLTTPKPVTIDDVPTFTATNLQIQLTTTA